MPIIVCPYCGKNLDNNKALSNHISKKLPCRKAQALAVAASFRRAKEATVDDAGDIDDMLDADEPQVNDAEDEMAWETYMQDESMDLDNQPAASTSKKSPYAATVEDYVEEEIEQKEEPVIEPDVEPVFDFVEFETFNKAREPGKTYGSRPTKFEQWRNELDKALKGESKAPFSSTLNEKNWPKANWLMTSGLTNEGRENYFQLPENKGKAAWKNNRQFMQAIDTLPIGPGWTVQEVKVKGDLGTEVYELWLRDPLECVKELLGNATFRDHMKYAPERHWKGGKSQENRQYNECWTGNWWWSIQELLGDGATVVPLILSSDATQLSTFSGDKKAWPVYLTLGNIAKGIRRQPSKHAQILVGYLPVAKGKCWSKDVERREGRHCFFHENMKKLVETLKTPGKTGILATCADGKVRHVFPILAAYVADFPEQCLVACCKESRCPVCISPFHERGDLREFPYRARRKSETIEAINEAVESKKLISLDALGLRPNPPFWAELPHANMFLCFTPDVLHQLHKGVFKDHMVKWFTFLLGEDEVDRRFKAMPDHHGLRHFKNGISGVKQWTGRELKQMERVFVGAVSGIPDRADAVHAARRLMDFIFRASYRSISEEELAQMEEDLQIFHSLKEVFIESGAIDTENGFHGIPKFHMLIHYVKAIREMGSSDGYTTETTERLHIDFAKIGWRASNKVDATAQMCIYLQRQEAIWSHSSFLSWRTNGRIAFAPAHLAIEGDSEDESSEEEEAEDVGDKSVIILTKHETYSGHPIPRVEIAKVASTIRSRCMMIPAKHAAPDFLRAVNEFVDQKVGHRDTRYHTTDLDYCDVWFRLRLLHHQAPYHCVEDERMKEAIRATPSKGRKDGAFDTVLMLDNIKASGLHCYKVVRVKIIFTLPAHCQSVYKGKLAYVEHFTSFGVGYHGVTHMQRITRETRNGRQKASVIPIEWIRSGCHLVPQFSLMEREAKINAGDLLESAPGFLFNRYANPNMFAYMDYWGD